MYADNETGKRAHRLLRLIKDAGHNTDAYPEVGYVKSTSPLTIYVEKSGIESTADTAHINPDLLARVEYASTTIDGVAQTLALEYESSLDVGDAVYVMCDVEQGVFYVLSKLTGGG